MATVLLLLLVLTLPPETVVAKTHSIFEAEVGKCEPAEWCVCVCGVCVCVCVYVCVCVLNVFCCVHSDYRYWSRIHCWLHRNHRERLMWVHLRIHWCVIREWRVVIIVIIVIVVIVIIVIIAVIVVISIIV